MIEVRNVSKSFADTEAVNDVSLQIDEGRTYAVVGKSGSGKTTLISLIMGLIKPTSGEIALNGTPILQISEKRRFSQLQLVMQDGKSALDPRVTIGKSIAEPMINLRKMRGKDALASAEKLLTSVGMTPEMAQRRPSELSGGEQKRVCIARALGAAPKYIFFDEATAGLDVIRRRQVLDLIRDLQSQNGFTAVFITHDLEVALDMAETIFVMKQGRLIETLERPFIPENMRHEYTRLLMNEVTMSVSDLNINKKGEQL